MKNKGVLFIILILSFLTVFTTGCSVVFDDIENNNSVCFWDNATFGEFSDEKIETFIIEEDTDVYFKFRGEIESGKIHVKVYSKDESNIIFETTDLNYEKEFNQKLSAGVYYYLLKVDKCTNGAIYNFAEINEKKGSDG